MRRRKFLEKAGIGSAALVLPALAAASSPKTPVQAQPEAEGHDHQHNDTSDSNATVTFGAWQTGPMPFDRFAPADPNDRTRNQHQLIPFVATIRAGGSVNFVISGFHNVVVYGNNTKPADINTTLLVPGSAPPLINDPNNRVYRGLDPRTLVVSGPNQTTISIQDRVEAVHFAQPGTYLVICGVLPHFAGGMFGYVRVLRARGRGDK